MKISKEYSCLLGGAYGEFLGSQVENLRSEDIKKIFPKEILPTKHCRLTDDWEMTKALAHALIQYKRVNVYEVHDSYVKFFTPEIGYSRQTAAILTFAKENGFALSPGTSICDGCLMRISPLAISGSRKPLNLLEQIKDCLYFTHYTSDALVCTLLYCGLLQYLLYHPSFDVDHIFSIMKHTADQYSHNELYTKIQLVENFYYTTTPEKFIEEIILGKQNHMQIRAVDCLCCSLFYFLKYRENPSIAIQEAIYGGGDTDTVAKLVGEMCGAYTKDIDWIPKNVVRILESKEKISDIAKGLKSVRL